MNFSCNKLLKRLVNEKVKKVELQKEIKTSLKTTFKLFNYSVYEIIEYEKEKV